MADHFKSHFSCFLTDINEGMVPKPALTFVDGDTCHVKNWDQASDIFQISGRRVEGPYQGCQSLPSSFPLPCAHKSHLLLKANTQHTSLLFVWWSNGFFILPWPEAVIAVNCWCFSTPSPHPPLYSVIDRSSLRTCLWLRCRDEGRASHWMLLAAHIDPDTKLGHFYHGLSSVYHLKAWLDGSIAPLLVFLFL